MSQMAGSSESPEKLTVSCSTQLGLLTSMVAGEGRDTCH